MRTSPVARETLVALRGFSATGSAMDTEAETVKDPKERQEQFREDALSDILSEIGATYSILWVKNGETFEVHIFIFLHCCMLKPS